MDPSGSLFKLPPELRLQVYETLLQEDIAALATLCRTAKWINHETSSAIYRRRVVDIFVKLGERGPVIRLDGLAKTRRITSPLCMNIPWQKFSLIRVNFSNFRKSDHSLFADIGDLVRARDAAVRISGLLAGCSELPHIDVRFSSDERLPATLFMDENEIIHVVDSAQRSVTIIDFLDSVCVLRSMRDLQGVNGIDVKFSCPPICT